MRFRVQNRALDPSELFKIVGWIVNMLKNKIGNRARFASRIFQTTVLITVTVYQVSEFHRSDLVMNANGFGFSNTGSWLMSA